MDILPSYETVERSDSNLDNFFTSLSGLKTTKNVLEGDLVKNRNTQRALETKILKERAKMKEIARKLKSMELRKSLLQQEYDRLSKEYQHAEGL